MATLPPIPAGFELERPPPRSGRRRDPWEVLQAEGFIATNGYRTDADVERIRRQGYSPATRGAHNRGDGVDLDHPRLSRRAQTRRLRQLVREHGWDATVLDEGHHRHLAISGWGAAPGTPGTPNSGLPPMPPGFDLEQRGPISPGNFVASGSIPPPPTNALAATLPDWGHGGIPRRPNALAPALPPPPMRAPAGAPGTAAVMPGDPNGTHIATTQAPEQLRAALGELEAAFDRGASRAQLIDIANRHGVPQASGPAWIRELDAALAWRAQNRGQLSAVGTFVPAEVERVRPDQNAPPIEETASIEAAPTAPQTPEEVEAWNLARIRQAEPDAALSTHTPDMAERWGERLSAVTEPLVGRHSANDAGANLESLLDWTVVGAYDADQEFREARNRALSEGRPLGAVGNLGGQALAGLGSIPIIGPGYQKVRRGLERGAAAFRRRLGQSASPEAIAAEEVSDAAGAALPAVQPRQVDRIDVNEIPPIPPGFTLEPQIGRVHPLGEQPDPADVAAAARSIRPEDVTPIPGNRVESIEEAALANPSSLRDVEGPAPAGRTPARPAGFVDWLKDYTRSESERGGVPVRIDAEDAISRGVPAEYIYRNPDVADRSKLRLRNPSIFGTRYGAMSATQQKLRSLDIDEVDPLMWGIEEREAGRLEPDDIADLIRRDFEGDESALMRGGQYDDWTANQRRQEEIAEFEGRFPEGPPVVPRGEPVGPDDLRAMDPPATAYEDLPALGGTVGNINLANIETATDIRRLLQNVEDRFGGFDAARRGTITHAETRALANELGLTPDDLLRRRRGQALNAEQALAARQLLAKSSDELMTLAQRAIGPQASDASRVAFSEALVRHAAIHEQVTGATAEAGRALSALRATARSRDVSGRLHQVAVDGMGGQQRLEDIAGRILDLQQQGVGPGAVTRFAADSMRPKLRDKLVELWYNWLLSGPQTHAVNTLSNMGTAVLQVPEQALAAGIGYARRAVRGARGQGDDFDRVLFSELGPRVVGLLQGAREGARKAGRTFLTGEVSDFVTKVESASQRAIGGPVGSVIRTPSRALAAEDEFFKAIARRMELNALAVRKARSEGLRGDELRERVAAISANPPPEMLERVMDYGRYLTFQRPLQGIPQDISRFTNRQPWFKLFLPFIRTPTNIFKFAVERSPFAPVLREVRQNFRAGGERRAVALSRMALGTGLGVMVTQWAAEGTITGAPPKSRGERDLLYASGWQPYSIRIGDTYYSYQRLDPLAMTLGTAANLGTLGTSLRRGDVDRAGAAFIASIIGNLSDKTWLSGISDLVGVLDDPGRNLEHFVARLGGSIAVPTGVAQIARTSDPLQRETRGNGIVETVFNRVQSRLPGVSQSLPARRNIWGEEVRNEGGLGPDIASPVWTREAQNDPIAQELIRLEAPVGRPARSLTVNGERRELTATEYDLYQQLAGQYLRADLQEAMAHPDWQASDDEERRERVRSIGRDARADARADLSLDSEDGEIPPLPPGFQLAQ